jgi:hypothetical protein
MPTGSFLKFKTKLERSFEEAYVKKATGVLLGAIILNLELLELDIISASDIKDIEQEICNADGVYVKCIRGEEGVVCLMVSPRAVFYDYYFCSFSFSKRLEAEDLYPLFLKELANRGHQTF